MPTLRIVQRGGYLASLALVLLIINVQDKSQIELVIFWAIIALGTEIPYVVYISIIARKEFKPKLEKFAITKYLLSSMVSFGITYIIMEKTLVYHTSIFQFLPELFQYIILGSCIYLGITYVIDSKTRKLFHSIISEVLKK